MAAEGCSADGVVSAAIPASSNPLPNLYVVQGRGDDVFYYYSETQAKKQLLVLSMQKPSCSETDDYNATTPTLDVFAIGKWANLTRVSSSTLDFTKLAKIPSEEMTKMVDLLISVRQRSD